MHATYAYAGHFKDIVSHTDGHRKVTFGGGCANHLTEQEVQDSKVEVVDRAWGILQERFGYEPPAATQLRQANADGYPAFGAAAAASSSSAASSSGKGSKK